MIVSAKIKVKLKNNNIIFVDVRLSLRVVRYSKEKLNNIIAEYLIDNNYDYKYFEII